MQIKSIHLYNHTGDIRHLNFETGSVNIITGQSNTGKSAIIPIIEYCLGVSDFAVPGDVIRKTVAYYAVIYQIENLEIFICKPAPLKNSNRQNRVIYLESSQVKLPALRDLQKHKQYTNDEEVRVHLTSLLQSKSHQISEIKSIENTYHYLFQKSTTINHDTLLFHNQESKFDEIKNSFPYFLGIYQEENIRLETALEEARLKQQRVSNNVSAEKRRVKEFISLGNNLLHEAQELQLIEKDIAINETTKILDFAEILGYALDTWQPSFVPPVTNKHFPRLKEELNKLKSDYQKIQLELNDTVSYQREAAGYTEQAEEQRLRLQSINLITDQNPFEFLDKATTCPLCNSHLSNSSLDTPRISAIRKSLQKLDDDLNSVRYEFPKLSKQIEELKNQLQHQQLKIDRKQLEIATVLRENKVQNSIVHEIVEANRKIERLMGRIELFIDIAKESNLRQLQEEKEMVSTEYAALQEQFKKYNIAEVKRRVLTTISRQMTNWASSLEFSYSGHFLLDIDYLTVSVDTSEQSFRMKELGGSNYLGCHLIALLAIHDHFIKTNQPVPNFLVLDQPAQGYYPSREAYEKAQDGDRKAVGKMFAFLFRVCEDLFPKMQIIVLEHANLQTDQRFQNALVNDEVWTNGLALIPQKWIEDLHETRTQSRLL